MRLKQMKKQMRVYMNPQDYDTMIDCADSRRAEVAMRCMGEMGLRVSEVADLKMEHIRESTHEDVDILFLTVHGKDTSGDSEDGKRRDVWLPRDLYGRLQTYASNENRSDSHPLILKSKRTIQSDIEASREHAVRKTGNGDFGCVSCHDFRAYFATNMLLREGVDVEVLMEIGGWKDRDSMDPYINASFDDIIQAGLGEAGVVADDIDTRPSEMQRVLDELGEIKMAINEIDSSIIRNESPPEQSGLVDF